MFNNSTLDKAVIGFTLLFCILGIGYLEQLDYASKLL